MRTMMFLAGAAALTVSAPIAAQSKELAEAKPSATKPADQKICKRLEGTGSRMSRRICLTKEEWKKVEEQMAS